MKREVITLQELVQWGVVGVLALLLGSMALTAWRRRRRASRRRKLRRRCSQCGLWEEIESKEEKFGVCVACGGVTNRGRSRKLG